MKKIFSVLLAFLMIFALCACNDTGQPVPAVTPTDGPGSELTAEDLYAAFLDGSGMVYADSVDFELYDYETDTTAPYFESGRGYTLDEFLLTSIRSEKKSASGSNLDSVSYGYIDCGADGAQELVLAVTFEDGYGSAPGYEYVIQPVDGKLQLRHRTESQYRYYESFSNRLGLIEYGGSTGSSSGISGRGYLDADCNYHFIYSEEYLYMLGAYLEGWNDICTYAAEEIDALPEDCWLNIYSFREPDGAGETAADSELLYCVEPPDNEAVQRVFEKAGVQAYSYEEIREILRAKYEELGIADIAAEENYPEWLPVENARVEELERFGADPVFVSNVDEFAAAVKDGAVIALQPGVYNVTEWLNEHIPAGDVEFCEYEADSPSGVLYRGLGDEHSFVINAVHDLKLVSADPAHPAEIVSEPRYELVIDFESCVGLTVQDLVMGHTPEKGVCSGDVIGLTECYDAEIIGCDLYGCGAYGIFASDCGYIDVTDCCIHDCSYGCVESWGSSIYFDRCSFADCEEFTMFNVSNGSLSFWECSFRNLQGDMLAMYGDSYAYFSSDCIYDAAALNSLHAYSGEGTLTID